ncbi:hypothetical protein XELAEV_18003664mg [Xenopus laevis]|uniref:Uncharacterized protein n=1 Tax=Xenopus laevis TaxID=8355 RepID=A0A974BN42_XENLA|nr:hypothetical protein XELAEV_18003664mg [Xenopus laevis]
MRVLKERKGKKKHPMCSKPAQRLSWKTEPNIEPARSVASGGDAKGGRMRGGTHVRVTREVACPWRRAGKDRRK